MRVCEICGRSMRVPAWRAGRMGDVPTVDDATVICVECVKVALLIAAAEVHGSVQVRVDYVMMLLAIQDAHAQRKRRPVKLLLHGRQTLGFTSEILRRVNR